MITATDAFKNVEGLAQKNNISFYALAKELNFPTSFFSEWKRGKMMPKADKLLAIAKYFGVPIEELLKEEGKE